MAKDKTQAKSKPAPRDTKRSWDEIPDSEREFLYNHIRQPGIDVAALIEERNLKCAPQTLVRRLNEWAQFRPRPVLPNGDFERYWKLYCRFIGRDPKRPLPKARAKKRTTVRKWAVLCDVHGWPHPGVVERVLAEPDLYGVVLDGDLLDASSFSRFPKLPSNRPSPITDEIARVRALMESFATAGLHQIINRGNHDDRVELYFSQHVDPEFLPLCKWNIVELLAVGIPNLTISQNVYDFTSGGGATTTGALHSNWITHLGDAVIGHAGIARKGHGQSVSAFAEWVRSWRRPLGWGDPGLIIQAHVHRACVLYPDGAHEVQVEGGFSGDPKQLQWQMDLGGKGGPPAVGFSLFQQTLKDTDSVKGGQWITDRSSVRFVMV